LVLKLSKGWLIEDALTFSINTPKQELVKDVSKLKIEVTNDHLISCRRDLQFLRKQTDIRNKLIEDTKNDTLKRGQHRNFKKFCKREKEKHEKIDKEKLEKHNKLLMQNEKLKKDSEYGVQSVYALVSFIHDSLHFLPRKTCQSCYKKILPKSLKKFQQMEKTSKMYPMRPFCGHWMHYKCLDKYLTEPPFIRICSVDDCGLRIQHTDWPKNIKHLERAWAAKQKKIRDIADTMDFLC